MAKKTRKRNILNRTFIVVGILAVIINILGLIFFKLEFFDIFGILIWIFFLIFGGWMLLTREETPDWVAWIVLIIGTLGFITDSWIVIKTFIIGG
ncbi:hypothetical protein J4218_02115 [Candidatus Pacearchaeota archaeon]|nr:hypothetical protein [uncultured archaeon]AQS29149.1 hypothetical protein [uncultured archaeon]MBS3078893.1 hypothetical protein [Candidatus Pacearchaeota archaeon]